MKKIFLILSMLICFQACHAVGVDCWEEYSNYFNPNTVSKMKDYVSGATIVRVKTAIRGVSYSAITGHFVVLEIPLEHYIDYAVSGYDTGYLNIYNTDYYSSYYTIVGGGMGFEAIDGGRAQNNTIAGFLTKSRGNALMALGNTMVLYVHTFCIVTDGVSSSSGSSGGGGGSAGAAVNYIIKAN